MHKSMIKNPVLQGFHPDPSALRVENDYYVAVSTFEWFPGVMIFHSTDLSSWRPVVAPLTRTSQLDLKGCPASGGVWAPNLSYADGLFWLIYTNMRNYRTPTKDLDNYLVTAPAINGPWSEPVYLNSSGFDPCLFHDDDGKKWLVNLNWDYRPDRNSFGGIIIQQYDPKIESLVGQVRTIIPAKGLQEGSNLFKKDQWYYLIIANGGTGLEHSSVTVRSKHICGPYEEDPNGIMMTSRYDATWPLQKAGHASIVNTPENEWYILHLAARPIPSNGRCTLGRETCLQKVTWKDGWPRLAHGDIRPALEVPAPKGFVPVKNSDVGTFRDDFNEKDLSIHFQSLRVPLWPESMSLSERPGWLRLKGGDSLFSKFRQSLVAKRWQHFCFAATTCIEFFPETYHQSAGLVCLYDHQNFYYLSITFDEALGRCLKVAASVNGYYTEHEMVSLATHQTVYLKAVVKWDRLRFFWSPDNEEWQSIAGNFDAGTLSDEFCNEGWFTGAMVGVCCQDLAGKKIHADFDWFEYKREECLKATNANI